MKDAVFHTCAATRAVRGLETFIDGALTAHHTRTRRTRLRSTITAHPRMGTARPRKKPHSAPSHRTTMRGSRLQAPGSRLGGNAPPPSVTQHPRPLAPVHGGSDRMNHGSLYPYKDNGGCGGYYNGSSWTWTLRVWIASGGVGGRRCGTADGAKCELISQLQ